MKTIHFVCWSIRQLIRDSARDVICIHVQHPTREGKTLCGVDTGRTEWDYEVHGDFEQVNCRRCLAAMRARSKEVVY